MSGIDHLNGAKYIRVLIDNEYVGAVAGDLFEIIGADPNYPNGIVARNVRTGSTVLFDPLRSKELQFRIESDISETITSGTKHDNGKPTMALLDSDFLTEVAAVLTFGATKYDPQNWRKGLSSMRLASAVLRHLFAYLKGEDKDPETGLSHLAHAACGLMFLFWTNKYKPELDDRFKYAEPK